ncbi:MAG: DNA gyrase/topoisomerase IV subunit A, partial [Muribaculaceae bacterium]|nr:DNA gyrase/topoisomerase IV subunit A [Muribaculaceae bacterium]
NEILDAAIAYLRGEEFTLLPDFQTGGLLDATRYNDGARGGRLKVRAKIEKVDNKTLAITEIPFSKTTTSIIASIIAAREKGKIKIRKVDDNTSATAQILVHLQPGTSSDKTIDALYAFTDCEVSISPNCCVIADNKPHFLTVSDVLRHSVDHTSHLLYEELRIHLSETKETQLFASLEKIFIEQRMYKDPKIENSENMEAALQRLDQLLEKYKPSFYREIKEEDLMRLWEIKMGRILKFNSLKADEKIARLDADIEQTSRDMENIRDYTIRWYEHLKEKYGARYPRRTVIREFDAIQATKVAEANKRFYYDKRGGFVGTGLKDAEFKFTCSDIDDILIIYCDGKYKLVKVQEKLYIGKKVKHIGLFKKNDTRTTYNLIYRNGKEGFYYKKRFAITGLTREKEYDMTKGEPGSLIKWLTVNPNGEAETVKIMLTGKPDISGRYPRYKEMYADFAELARKGKESLGNLVTKYEIKEIVLDKKGASTLQGREVWFDHDVLRLNYDRRGESLGIFQGNDQVLVITKNGEYYTTSYSDTNHYNDDILRIEKFDSHKVWTLALYDSSLGFYYLKRFQFASSPRPQRFVGNDETSRIALLTDTFYPRIEVTFGGHDSVRPAIEIDAEEFIGVKGIKAKGKRITTYEVAGFKELEPLRQPEPEPEPAEMPETDLPETSESEQNEEEENDLLSSVQNHRVVIGELFEFDQKEESDEDPDEKVSSEA